MSKLHKERNRKVESGGVIRPQAISSQLQPPTLLRVCLHEDVHISYCTRVCVCIRMCVCVFCRSATSLSSHSEAKNKHSGSHYTH